MSDTKYLTQRYQTWFIQLPIPTILKDYYSTSKIVKTLETRDLMEARIRRDILIGQYKAEFEHKKALLKASSQTGLTQVQEALHLKKEISAGLHGQNQQELLEGASIGLDESRDTYLRPTGRHAKGVEIDKETGYRAEIDQNIVKQYQLASEILTTDTPVELISTTLEDYLTDITHLRIQTQGNHKRRVTQFIEWLGDKKISDITKRDASRFLIEVVQKFDDLAPRTKKQFIGDISSFFTWCVERHYCDENPFIGLTKRIKETTRGTREKSSRHYQPFTIDELSTIFESIDKHRGITSPLFPFSLIALYSGMRSNELAETEIGDVHSDHIHIPEGKTETSVRDVPIHPLLKPLIHKLKEISSDGFLISNLKCGGVDNKRNHYIAKKAGNLIRGKAGITDKTKVFHSFRKNFATALENAGVPESTSQQLMGHKKKSMTYSLYSQGVDLPVLINAVNSVSYIDSLEKQLSELIESYLIRLK